MAKNKKNQNGSITPEGLSKENKEDMKLLDRFFKRIENVQNYDWKNSTFNGFKQRFFVDSKVILYILAGIRNEKPSTIQDCISKNLSAIYWQDRILTNNDLGSENRLSFLKCQARDLILLTRYYICSHENVDLEGIYINLVTFLTCNFSLSHT